MARVLGLTFCLFMLICSVVVSPCAQAFATEGDAYSACMTAKGTASINSATFTNAACLFDNLNNVVAITDGSCPTGGETGRYHGHFSSGEYYYYWCLPVCVAGEPIGTSDTAWGYAFPSGGDCVDGCLYTFDGVSASYSDGTSGSWGTVTETNQLCSAAYAGGPPVVATTPPPKPCGGSSCYDPQHGFCAVTDSGEQFCTGSDPQPGKCVSGATGAMCLGDPSTPPPSPPDPPIPSNQPPDHTDTQTQTTSGGSGGSTTTTITINNYNGSDTSGGSTPGSSVSSGLPGSSNSNGDGNSGQKGTDGTGKCPDGSVPTASGCSGTFSDGGCDTPPACYGDAVLCGIGRETWALRCADQKGNDWLQKQVDGMNDPGPAPSSSTVVGVTDLGDGSGQFNETGLGWDRTCPSNPTFTVYGKTFTVDLTNMCSIMSTCGTILLIISYLVGLAIVSRGTK